VGEKNIGSEKDMKKMEKIKEAEETIVCALCGKPICRSERTIGLLVIHYKLISHQRLLRFIVGDF